MRVAIEATTLSLTSGGLARYTAELSLALARSFPDDDFFLLSDQPFAMPAGAPPNLMRGAGPANAIERRWWLWGIHNAMRRAGADLVHGPDFAVPYLGRRPSVMTLHDLSPWMDEGWHHAAGRVRLRTPLLLELGIATMVITPAESVRKQAIDRFHLKPERVVAIPEAAASWLRPVEIPAKPDVPPRNPYFLYVGTLEPRKNLGTLVEAWREVRRRHAVDLVLAGRRREDFGPQPGEPGLGFAGEVPDAALAALYSGAVAFVYPSHYEGFGLPVIEAMQWVYELLEAEGGTQRHEEFQKTFGSGENHPMFAQLESMTVNTQGFLGTIAQYKPDFEFGIGPNPVRKAGDAGASDDHIARGRQDTRSRSEPPRRRRSRHIPPDGPHSAPVQGHGGKASSSRDRRIPCRRPCRSTHAGGRTAAWRRRT